MVFRRMVFWHAELPCSPYIILHCFKTAHGEDGGLGGTTCQVPTLQTIAALSSFSQSSAINIALFCIMSNEGGYKARLHLVQHGSQRLR